MNIGGWLIGDSFYCKLTVIPSIWTFTRLGKDNVPEVQASLFFIGWYTKIDKVKMWSMIILGLKLDISINL